jgi:hypothetical protein
LHPLWRTVEMKHRRTPKRKHWNRAKNPRSTNADR